MPARKRTNGEGTIYRRKDGRWEAAAYVTTTTGVRKRLRIYGRTREEVHQKLVDHQRNERQGIPVPERRWRLDTYLDYWLEEVVRRARRPATYSLYEMISRLYLKPGLGTYPLERLSVPMVQNFLNQRLEVGDSVRKVQIMRTALSSALTQAMREELVMRNVARLVVLPEWRRREISAWSSEEARQFLRVASYHRLYPAFLLLMLYGLRRGEVLGLRWCDVDFDDGTIHVRQQVQRVGRQLLVGPTKTQTSQRDLPMMPQVQDVLMNLRRQQGGPANRGEALVFTTASGRAIEPRNLVRTFDSLCKMADLRRIRLHDLRRTVASLLNKLGVQARDTQIILGHSRISVTQELYTDVDRDSRATALRQLHEGLLAAN